MKIYIQTDLEGISGLTDYEMETHSDMGRGIAFTKEILTSEINAAIKGILDACAESDIPPEIVVQDGHGGGYWGSNILSTQLAPPAELIIGRRPCELTAIDDSFDALFMIGTHSMAGTPNGNLNHTISSSKFYNYYINDNPVGEIGICSAIAAHYSVPLSFVCGDYWAMNEALELHSMIGNKDLVTVATKKGINRYTAQCYPLQVNLSNITNGAHKATKLLLDGKRIKPLELKDMNTIKVDYIYSEQADNAEKNYYAKRTGNRQVIFSGGDFPTLVNASYT